MHVNYVKNDINKKINRKEEEKEDDDDDGGGDDDHYSDVIMSAMASQITGVSIVSVNVCLGADQRKHQSSAPLAFVRGIHQWHVDSPYKDQWRGDCFHLMTSSWILISF